MTYYFSKDTDFYMDTDPQKLADEYGTPLYVYNEDIFRTRCREMTALVPYEHFKVTYSMKANSNLTLLKIAREEGLHADAMSPGEIYVLEKAGFANDEIFYISNNVSDDEMKFAIDRGIMTSVDSLSQLRRYGRLNPGGEVCVRFNPGVGAGHHEKVVTAGKATKFGVNQDKTDDVKAILKEYDLRLAGINQHIGSLFMEGGKYLESVRSILKTAVEFEDIDFVDFGGGFGIPYKKQEGQERLELKEFGQSFADLLNEWTDSYGKKIMFRIEPGRYISAECCILLGDVYVRKNNYEKTFIGTDLGFYALVRPVMYDSHHEVEVYRNGKLVEGNRTETATIVGNICESGDIIAKERELPIIEEGDIIGVMDAGAYGFSMSSNYNNRLRPAEVLIASDGSARLIRRRDTLEDLMRNF
ncbi:MAG: diaminopimelate decarboxylase [Clostridia bacterium]|nr:diaminopimelate decarboxylase [Clostridia bacterium]